MLFAPHHARKGLSLNVAQVIRHRQGAYSVVKVVGFLFAALDNVIKFLFVEIRLSLLGEAKTNN